MSNNEEQSPFQHRRNRVQQIIAGLFDDFAGLIFAVNKDRFNNTRSLFGVVRVSGRVTTIEHELWRIIRAREWEESKRDRPLKNDELELILQSLADRGSYSDHRGESGWRFLEGDDVTTIQSSRKWEVHEEDRKRFLEQTGFSGRRSAYR